MGSFRKLSYITLVLSLVLVLLGPTIMVMAQEPPPCEPQEGYECDSGWRQSQNDWIAQIFTSHGNYDIDRIKLLLTITAGPPEEPEQGTVEVTVSVAEIDVQGLPELPTLGSDKMTMSGLGWQDDWVSFEIRDSAQVSLNAWENYAIILSWTSEDESGLMYHFSWDNPYEEGYYFESNDGGSSWNDMYSDEIDLCFEVYGNCDEEPAMCVGCETSLVDYSSQGDGASISHTFSVPTGATVPAQLRVAIRGDGESADEYADVDVEGDYIGTVNPNLAGRLLSNLDRRVMVTDC